MAKYKEHFDLNGVQVIGTVQKLWGRGGDVFARLRVSTRGKIEEAEDAFSYYINLRFPEGEVQGTPVSLSPGIAIRVAGFLTHTQYQERILKFLDAAGAGNFLENTPDEDRQAWSQIRFRRRNAMLNVLGIQWIGADVQLGDADLLKEYGKAQNKVNLEGIVAKVWEYPHGDGVHLFIRIACYDKYTPTVSGKGDRFGRPRRKPHYLTVKFSGGKVNGIPIRLENKLRIRVTGKMADQGGSSTLREQLLDMGSEDVIDLMGRLPNADKMGEISAQHSSLHVEAESLIVYSAVRKGLKV